MKFKAVLTNQGVSLLDRRFVPAFEKIGKTCHVYLSPSEIILMHNVLTTDGVQAVAQFPQEALFEEYRIASQYEDCIAFTVDLALLGRALRSSQSMAGEKLQVKLVKKSASPLERALPYLTFESKGYRAAIVQDVPISAPLGRAEVQSLQAAIELVQDLPRTLVQLPDLVQLQGLVDKLRSIGEILDVGVSQQGDFFMRIATSSVSIGTEFRQLQVWGATATPSSANDGLSASARLQQALACGQASAVKVSMKHFARSLQCHLTKPDASYCGVAPNDACLLMMFQYAESNISLQYRLPVLDSSED